MPGYLRNHGVRHSLREKNGWPKVPEVVNVEILDLCFLAGLDERFPEIPTVRSLKLRGVGASVSPCRRKQIVAVPKTRKVLQFFDGARRKRNDFRVVVLGNWDLCGGNLIMSELFAENG